jgi:quinoprotein glucose dehydrogenase
VAQSDVPGEKTSPTQPFPTRPAPFDRQGVTVDDLIDYTPALRAEAERFASKYRMGPLFTPPVVSKPNGPLGTLMLPSEIGGANWPGGAFDPETNRLYIHSLTQIYVNSLVEPAAGQSDMRYVKGVARGADGNVLGTDTPSIQGLPLVKPPYDRLTAYDMNRGEIVWWKPHSTTPDTIRNNPALKGVTLPERTGQPGRTFLGTLVTKTLVVMGDGGFHTNARGERGALLRAYDKATGADAGSVFMPAPQVGSPITYLHNGKQYIVLAISGGNYSGELIAFALP